jgi:hypothetical protein
MPDMRKYSFDMHRLLSDEELVDLKQWLPKFPDSCGVGWRIPIGSDAEYPIVVEEISHLFFHKSNIKAYEVFESGAIEVKSNLLGMSSQSKLPTCSEFKEKKLHLATLPHNNPLVHVAVIDSYFLSALEFKIGERFASPIFHGEKAQQTLKKMAPACTPMLFEYGGKQNYSAAVLIAIVAAAKRGVDIINVSINLAGKSSSAYQNAVDYALCKGAVIVAGVANNGDSASALSVCDGVISVHRLVDNPDSESESDYVYDCQVDVPELKFTIAGTEYGYGGDSAATALISAEVALLKIRNPHLTGAALREQFLLEWSTK